MNMKRWFAILGASLLLLISIFVNTVSTAFSTDWTSYLEDFASASSSEFLKLFWKKVV